MSFPSSPKSSPGFPHPTAPVAHGLLLSWTLLASLAVGCKDAEPVDSDSPVESDTDTDTDADTDADTDIDTDTDLPVDTGTTPGGTGLDACTDLAITPDQALVEANATQVLVASGGTGAYEWSIGPGGLGSISASGIYAAPDTPGTETVVLGDAGCTGSVSATIDVITPLVVQPLSADVPPGSSVSIEVSGGSVSFGCSLSTNQSGATLSGCNYTAGATPGLDVVLVEDLQTGATGQSVLTVTPDAALDPIGSVGWMFPVGMRFDPDIVGGSGRYSLSVGNPSLAQAGIDPDTDGAFLEGLADGATTVTVQDRHVGALSWTGQLRVLQAFSPPTIRNGQFAIDPRSLSVDLDGDGFEELVVGLREASITTDTSGWVGVYAGTADGPDVASGPIWEMLGDQDNQELGQGLATGDLNGDGVLDLVIGAPRTDLVRNVVGRVTVHLGDGTGGFDSEPYATFHGDDGNSELGNGVAACDVDGDGLDDLIASDVETDDATGTSRAGSIKVWRQQVGGGFPLLPVVRPGVRLSGSWTPVDQGRLGEVGLVAGDVDHDGLCDVVASIDGRDWVDDSSGPGFVLVWGGDANEGVTAEPIRVFHPDGGDTGVRFGRYLAIGDVDGVTGPAGLPDDLLVGARGYDGDDGTTNTAGGAFLFLGGSGGALEYTRAAADWTMQGSGGNDLVGEGVGITNDGDLLVAARGENQVHRVPGRAAFVPGDFSVDLPPAGLVLTPTAPDGMDARLFGLTASAFGDGVFATSRYDEVALDGSVVAIDARALHGVAADGTTTTWTVGAPSGMEYGRRPVLFDVDGDGSEDVVLGGQEAPNPLEGAQAGRVRARTASGWVTLGDQGPTWSNNDRRGYLMAVGDVDGSGSADLLELARTDSRPDDPGLDLSCGSDGRNSTGHLAVHVDGADSPSMLWWPPENSARPEAVVSGLDADGDGFEDVWVGLSNDTAVMVYGQAAPPAGQTAELCRQEVYSGAGGDFGVAVTTLGDLDGDGCDEVAVGSPTEDLLQTDSGAIRVLWGWSGVGACSQSQPMVTVLAMDSLRSRLGASMMGGVDVTNDGVPDLALGGTNRDVGSDRIGDALLVPGDWLATLASHPAPGNVFPDGPVEQVGPPDHPTIGSVQPSSEFGSAIALIRASNGGRWVAVGMPEASQASQSRSGAVAVYGLSNGAIEPEPSWWISGESIWNDARFGHALTVSDDQLVIGIPGSHADGNVHVGGAVVAPF